MRRSGSSAASAAQAPGWVADPALLLPVAYTVLPRRHAQLDKIVAAPLGASYAALPLEHAADLDRGLLPDGWTELHPEAIKRGVLPGKLPMVLAVLNRHRRVHQLCEVKRDGDL